MGGVSFPMLKVYKYIVTVENIVTVNIYTGNKAQVQHRLIKRPIIVSPQGIQLCTAWRLYGRSFQKYSIYWVSDEDWYPVRLYMLITAIASTGRCNFYTESIKPKWWPNSVPFMPPNHCQNGKIILRKMVNVLVCPTLSMIVTDSVYT